MLPVLSSRPAIGKARSSTHTAYRKSSTTDHDADQGAYGSRSIAVSDPIVVTGIARTPMGGFLGALAPATAPQLGATAIAAALADSGLAADNVDQVHFGCVLPAGLGQAPARQAALGAGLPHSVACTTVNKMCGSGMQAAILAHDTLLAQSASVAVCGGMESMSNSPHLLLRSRTGNRLGAGELKDHMFVDGLEDAYEPGRLMGTFAEDTARAYGFTREAQDLFAIASLERALAAIGGGGFEREIAAVALESRGGRRSVDTDEQPGKASPEKIPLLKAAFARDGSVTAANSSSISDGAAALVLMRRSEADRRGARPLASLRAHAVHAQAPAWFTTAPVEAIRKVVAKAGWTLADVDLFEINEAFAVVTMAAMRDLDLPHDKVNVHGGACALGHPIGASGARIIVTLLAALERYDLRRGVAALCIGGGEATAVAVERA
jgi:acetyl-CoA C-acetyltransferase